jgi:hypothetical protein
MDGDEQAYLVDRSQHCGACTDMQCCVIAINMIFFATHYLFLVSFRTCQNIPTLCIQKKQITSTQASPA